MTTQTLQFQLFPALTGDEYSALKEDIARNGILIPIEIDADTGALLDGHHRRQIAAELGIDAPEVRRSFASDADRIAHVIALNFRRRQLDAVTRGDFLIRYAEAKGVDLGQGSRNDLTSATFAEVTAELGIPDRTARYYMAAARLPEILREKVRNGDHTVRTALQELGRQLRIKGAVERESDGSRVPPGPGKLYQTIVVDPPWEYDRADIRGAASHHYDTMTFDEIAAYPVGLLAQPNAHLYLWVTNPHLPYVWRIVEAWGFDYKTMITWIKPQMGNGHYFRGATEHVLFAVRGDLPIQDRGLANWFSADRTEHSSKPDAFYELVEQASFGPMVELFSRRRRDGWDAYGDEVTHAE